MKKLLLTLMLLTSVALGQGSNGLDFKKELLPLIQKSSSYHLIFENFDFHPSYVYLHKTEKVESITALVSHSPGEKGSAVWSHFVYFTIVTAKDGQRSISAVTFSDCNTDSQPCFMPKEVYSIGKDKQLVVHQMDYTPPKLDAEKLKKALPFSEYEKLNK